MTPICCLRAVIRARAKGNAGTVGPPDEKLTCGIKDRFAEKVRSELGHKTENVVWQ